MAKTITVKGPTGTYEFSFERRRYAGDPPCTYTWAWVHYKDQCLSLGDPWPCLTPKRSELVAAAMFIIRLEDLKAAGIHEREASAIAGRELAEACK